MFKKSLAAIAILGAFGTSAIAANVSLYGVLDQGLAYEHVSTKNFFGDKTTSDEVGMVSGTNAPSRWGLKGSEELGNGLQVSFKLENGFEGDDGTLKQDGRLFGREASLSLSGNFGTISFGRMGGVGSSCGTYDLVYGTAEVFDGLDNDVGGLATSDRYDNMVTYQTPAIAGVQATLQYSFKQDAKDGQLKNEREGSANSNRYAAAALTGEFGNLNLVAAYEYQNYSNVWNLKKDGHTVYVGGNYNCGFATTFAMAQYFKGITSRELWYFDAEMSGQTLADLGDDGIKGYGLHLGTSFPIASGDLMVGLYFVDAKSENVPVFNTDVDLTYNGISARYVYPLSQRTSIYAGAGYAETKYEILNASFKEKLTQAYLGMSHSF